MALFGAASAPKNVVAGACYRLVQYSRFSAQNGSGEPFCRQSAAATVTRSRPTTSSPPSGVLDGGAANAGPRGPQLGVLGGGRWVRCTRVHRLPPPTER
jgi:hypothetical protein